MIFFNPALYPDPVACSHHRAPDYFSESIQSSKGFYGWPCASYISYLLGFCPRTSKIEVVAGEDSRPTMTGMFMITTNSESPFATGQWTDSLELTKSAMNTLGGPKSDPFQQHIDQWGKLEGTYNNVDKSNKRLPDWVGGGSFDGYNNIESLRSPSEVWRANDKYSTNDNYFMQYRYNLTQGFISDENFQVPKIQV